MDIVQFVPLMPKVAGMHINKLKLLQDDLKCYFLTKFNVSNIHADFAKLTFFKINNTSTVLFDQAFIWVHKVLESIFEGWTNLSVIWVCAA